MGYARRFRPRYASANLGHPSCFLGLVSEELPLDLGVVVLEKRAHYAH